MRLFIIIFLIICLLFITSIVFADEIVNILHLRYNTGENTTRIVFDLSIPIRYKVDSDKNKNGINIIIKGNFQCKSNYKIEDGIVDKISLIKEGEDTHIKVYFVEPTTYAVFTLPKYEKKPPRLVIDVDKSDKAIIPKKEGEKIIIIDPGHGGEDPGAVGPAGTCEKDIVLQIAKYMEKMINATSGYRAYLTRTDDYFVPLRRRTDFADKYNGDIFISIHANSVENKEAFGTEVFFLDLKGAKDKRTKLLEEAENASDVIAGQVHIRDNDDIGSILIDLRQTDAIEKSSILATLVHRRLSQTSGIYILRIKQAAFGVLKSIQMPSILAEVAFISHKVEERQLKNPDWQKRVAKAMFSGIKDYFAYKENPTSITIPNIPSNNYYTVQEGDSLWKIANKFNVSLKTLKTVNNITNDRICIGQKIIIP